MVFLLLSGIEPTVLKKTWQLGSFSNGLLLDTNNYTLKHNRKIYHHKKSERWSKVIFGAMP
jgi:hypothetical protein